MDDAHLAEHCLHSLFSVQISAHSHESWFKTLVSEVRERFPEYTVLSDVLAASEAASGTPPEPNLSGVAEQSSPCKHE